MGMEGDRSASQFPSNSSSRQRQSEKAPEEHHAAASSPAMAHHSHHSRLDDLIAMEPSDTLLFEKRSTDEQHPRWEATLHLKNLSEFHVGFKVKTTAPKSYLVRPNKGIIDPQQEAYIRFSLHGPEADINERLESQDRFMFECTALTAETVKMLSSKSTDSRADSLNDFFKGVKKTDLMKKKLDSTFTLAPAQSPQVETEQVPEKQESQSNVPLTYSQSPQTNEEYISRDENYVRVMEEHDSRPSDQGFSKYHPEPDDSKINYDYKEQQQQQRQQEMQQYAEKLEEELSQAKQQRSVLEERLHTLEERIADLQQQVITFKTENDQLIEERDSCIAREQKLEKKRKRLQEKYEKAKDDLESDAENQGYQLSLFQVILVALISFMAARLLSAFEIV